MREPPPEEEEEEEGEEGEDNDPGPPWCGIASFQYQARTFTYYLCVGVPITVCWMELDEVCRTASASPGPAWRNGVFAEAACSVSEDSYTSRAAL